MDAKLLQTGLGELLAILICGGSVLFVVLIVGLAILVKVLGMIQEAVGKILLIGCYLLIALGCCLLLIVVAAAPMLLSGV